MSLTPAFQYSPPLKGTMASHQSNKYSTEYGDRYVAPKLAPGVTELRLQVAGLEQTLKNLPSTLSPGATTMGRCTTHGNGGITTVLDVSRGHVLYAPPKIPNGFGDKVALSFDGSMIASEGEWTVDEATGVTTSAVYVAQRMGAGLSYTPWVRVQEPKELLRVNYDPAPEFGTSIKLTANGQQLLTTIEDVWLPVLQSQNVAIGFIYRSLGPGSTQFVFREALQIAVSIDPALLAEAQQSTNVIVDTSRGLMSDDGRTIAITTQIKIENRDPEGGGDDPDEAEQPGKGKGTGGKEKEEDGEEEAEQQFGDLPGRIYVFQQSGSGSYRQIQEMSPPPNANGILKGANFGKNSCISGDGNWIAATEDTVGGFYVYGRPSSTGRFSLRASVTGLFPSKMLPGNEGAETEAIALSTDGSFLVVCWKNPESRKASASESGAFAVYARTAGGYQQLCSVDTGVKELDGMKMATLGSTLRILMGFSGVEGQVWDIDTSALQAGAPPPRGPTLRIPATYRGKTLNNTSDPNNVDTVFEGVDISRDGRTLALGMEGRDAVLLFQIT